MSNEKTQLQVAIEEKLEDLEVARPSICGDYTVFSDGRIFQLCGTEETATRILTQDELKDRETMIWEAFHGPLKETTEGQYRVCPKVFKLSQDNGYKLTNLRIEFDLVLEGLTEKELNSVLESHDRASKVTNRFSPDYPDSASSFQPRVISRMREKALKLRSKSSATVVIGEIATRYGVSRHYAANVLTNRRNKSKAWGKHAPKFRQR